jgi:hypothetical protein
MIITSQNKIHPMIEYYGAEDFTIIFIEKSKGNAEFFQSYNDWYVKINNFIISAEADNQYSIIDLDFDDYVAEGSLKEMIGICKKPLRLS